MFVAAGSLQINVCMEFTLCAILQTKFQYTSTVKCMVYQLPYYQLNFLVIKQEA